MIIVRLLSPGPWLVGTTKVYSGVGADIVMESISLTTDHPAPLGQSSSSQLVQSLITSAICSLTMAGAHVTLEHISGWLDVLHSQIDLRLAAVVRSVSE